MEKIENPTQTDRLILDSIGRRFSRKLQHNVRADSRRSVTGLAYQVIGRIFPLDTPPPSPTPTEIGPSYLSGVDLRRRPALPDWSCAAVPPTGAAPAAPEPPLLDMEQRRGILISAPAPSMAARSCDLALVWFRKDSSAHTSRKKNIACMVY